MKRILTLILSAIILSATSLHADDRVFTKLPSGPNVEKVYIGKTLLKAAGRINNNLGNQFGLTISDNARLESLETVSAVGSSDVQSAYTIMKSFINDEHLETLLTKEEGYSWTAIYGKMNEDSNSAKILVVCNYDVNEIQIVIMRGNLTVSNIR
ncbi:MAG: DUF4252 domain-containing protein [Muribaculaceae bacterium]|nr:DUF4252 domain-containing protein [Bacteroidales bacterium]MDE6242762.1 DUF4252 domain-containing protein [Muribaculaceae bacterium]